MTMFVKFVAIFTIAVYFEVATAREAGPQGIFELRLKRFRNYDAADSLGRCCADPDTRPSDNRRNQCGGECRTKFRVCLKHFMAQIDTSPSAVCTFGERLTPVVGSNNITHIDLAPIRFEIDFKWPGTFSLIIEAWHERKINFGKDDDNVEVEDRLLHRITKSQSLDSGAAWEFGDDPRLEYDYRLVCADSYYGKDCDRICKPRDDKFGHYTCGPDGERLCLPGWERDAANGGYCTKPQCAPGCNTQNGYCSRPGECTCHEGWEGHDCNDCKVYPGCVHGTCSKPYTCQCKQGWGGFLCNKDLNYCTNHRPCHNGATCFNTGNDYTCSCPIGFSGKNCEVRVINKCLQNPCANGGECMPGSHEEYTCSCQPGFYGPHCEFQNDFDICSSQPCENSATCIPTRAGYTCSCPPGFEGRNCEINKNDCEVNPCRNGGTCFDFINSYKCICPNGYIGRHCEENYDDCKNSPCANGGTCTDGVNDFTCTCTPGYTGKDCSLEINECNMDPCLNGGFCIDGNNTFTCRCLPRYSGRSCEILPDGTIDPKYYELRSVLLMNNGGSVAATLDSNEDGENSANMALVVGFSVVIPFLVVTAAMVVFCMKQRRKHEQRRADFEAHLENELNAVNSMNKTKMLDDHMIVNSLDYPSSNGGGHQAGMSSMGGGTPHKSLNTNLNLADEELFSAKDTAYARSAPSPHGKKLNIDNCHGTSAAQQQQTFRPLSAVDKASFLPTAADLADSRFGGGSGSMRSTPPTFPRSQHHQLGGQSPHGVGANSRYNLKTKSTNLDVSSSTLCSSSSEKSTCKKELNRDPLQLGGSSSCGSASPAPSSIYGETTKNMVDGLLATEV